MSKPVKPDATELLTSAEWLLYQFNVRKRQFEFTAMNEADYRESVFLDGRIKRSRKQELMMGFGHALRLFLAAGPPPTRVSWVFHGGHCGSTLLSRALDCSDAVLPLREPQTLVLLADIQRELGQAVCLFSEENIEHLRRVFVFAHSRTFRPGQRPVVKATSTCNNLILPLMDDAPGSCAVLLYQPLEQDLAGRLKSRNGSFDLMVQARARMQDWMAIPDAPKLHNSRLATEQLAVLAWLTNMHHLLKARDLQPQRTRLVNFEDFLAEPDQVLSEITGFLGLDTADVDLSAHYQRISRQYSKNPGKPFTASDRSQLLHEVLKKRNNRIARAMRWAEKLINAVPALEPVGSHLV